MTRRILAWVAFGLISVLYVSALVSAVGNAVLMPQMAANMGLGINATGWFWLSFGVLLPVLAFVLAWFFGRRRSGGMKLLFFAAGLSLLAIAQINVMHTVPQSIFFV